MSNEYQIKVTTKNDGGVKKLGADAKAAGKEIEQGLEKGAKGGEQAVARSTKKIGDDLDATARKAHKAGEDIGEGLSEGIDRGGSKAGGKLDGALNDAFDAGKAGAVGAGLAIGTALLGGMAQSFGENQLGGLLAAQTGASSDQAGKLGNVIGATFADNFGDSLEEVKGALQGVLQSGLIDVDATEADLQRLTGLAVTASQVVGEEAGAIARAAQQLLLNDLAGSSEEAMDIIVTASQRGLNVNGDLLDTIVEYSTKWRDLGINAPEALGLISQAMHAGARDTDFAADALKEFAIKAIDGSESTVRGFEAIGLSAEEMGGKFAEGGKSARDALGVTLDKLRAIEDPLQRDQAAVDLFGTKAEDLGDALYAMDLDTVAKGFDKVGGATQQAADDIAKSTPKWESAWRKISRIPGDVFEGAATMVEWDPFGTSGIDDAQQKIKDYQRQLLDSGRAKEEFNQRVEQARNAWRSEAGAMAENTESLEENIKQRKKMADGFLGFMEAQNAAEEALDSATEALKENGRTLDVHTEKGRANREALQDVASSTFDLIEAMESQGSTSEEISEVVARQRDQFIGLAIKMGLSATEAQKLADKLGLIPGNYEAHVAVKDNASSTLRTIEGKLIDITKRDWVSSVSVVPHIVGVGSGKMFKGAGGAVVGQRVSTAAEGGARGGFVVKDELGPEVTQMPDGSTVWPAGLSRQLMMAAAGGMGGGGTTNVVLGVERNADGAVAVMLRYLIDERILRLRVDSSGRVAVA